MSVIPYIYFGTKKITRRSLKRAMRTRRDERCFFLFVLFGTTTRTLVLEKFRRGRMRFQTVSNFTIVARPDYINYSLLVNSALYDCSIFEKKGEKWFLWRVPPRRFRHDTPCVPHKFSHFGLLAQDSTSKKPTSAYTYRVKLKCV